MAAFLVQLSKACYESLHSMQYCLGGDRDHHGNSDRQENRPDRHFKTGVDGNNCYCSCSGAIDLLFYSNAKKTGVSINSRR